MTEPTDDVRRWRVNELLVATPTQLVVAAADFDRLSDERDRAVEAAGVLADALRNAPCYCDHRMRAGLPPCSRCSALAVFDTLTEENADA